MSNLTTSACAFILYLSWIELLSAEQKPTIHWARYQLEPFFINQSEGHNNGIADQLFLFLQQRLPQFEHRNYFSNVSRILRDFSEDKIICTSLTKMKGREQLMRYSDPAVILPSHRLLYLKAQKPLLEPLLNQRLQESISIQSLFTNPAEFHLGLLVNRSYGQVVNQLIKDNPQKVRTFPVNSPFTLIYQLMLKKRIQFTIEYPIVAYYHLKKLGIQQQVASLSIQENNQQLYAYITCSNNAKSAAVLNAINQLIAEHKSSQIYFNFVAQWLPKDALSNYRRVYREFAR